MGFGLLLCAYFMLTLMVIGVGDYAFAVYVIGGLISLKATLSLKDYCPRFIFVTAVSALYVLLGIYHAVSYLDTLFLWNLLPIDEATNYIVQAVGYVVELAYHVFMLWAIMDLTGELDMIKLKGRSTANLVLAAIWGVGQIILVAYPPLASFSANVFPKMLLLWALVCYVLNVFLLHSCYQNICPAGEEYGKERKPSRFAFVNRLNDKFDEKSAQALQESLDYHAQKRLAREEKKKNKKKKR